MRIEDSKIPRALYPCAMDCEHTYEARYLAWYPGCDKYEPGYYCDECLDANDMHKEGGEGFYTLWLELKRRELNETNEEEGAFSIEDTLAVAKEEIQAKTKSLYEYHQAKKESL